MKRILLLVLATGVLWLGACGAPTAEAPSAPTAPAFTGGPRIFFEQDSVYLGEATPEQQMYHEFRFQNVGDAPLVVHDTTAKVLEGC